jgi:hypothetical protein
VTTSPKIWSFPILCSGSGFDCKDRDAVMNPGLCPYRGQSWLISPGRALYLPAGHVGEPNGRLICQEGGGTSEAAPVVKIKVAVTHRPAMIGTNDGTMTGTLRAAKQDDLPALSKFLVRAYKFEPADFHFDPQLLEWKYLYPRTGWQGGRSSCWKEEGRSLLFPRPHSCRQVPDA